MQGLQRLVCLVAGHLNFLSISSLESMGMFLRRGLACSPHDTVQSKDEGAGRGHPGFLSFPACLLCLLLFWLRITRKFQTCLPIRGHFLMLRPHLTPSSKLEACLGGYKAVPFSSLISQKKTPDHWGEKTKIIEGQVFFPGHELPFYRETYDF